MASNVILIFDGLDELKVNNEVLADEKPVKSLNQVSHIFPIFKQLVKGKLLPGVTLLTTSRPTAEHIYQALELERTRSWVFKRGKSKIMLKRFAFMTCRKP